MSYEEKKQDREIERLRAKAAKMEFLMRSTDDTCLACATKLEVIDQQTARIQALEGTVAALREIAVEERARALWFVGSDPTKPPNLDWEISPNKISEKVKNLWRTPAHSQLQAEHPEVFQ